MKRGSGDDRKWLRASITRRWAWPRCDCDPHARSIDAVCFDELKKSARQFFISWCVCYQKTIDTVAKSAEMSIKEGWRSVVDGQRVKDAVAELKSMIVCKECWCFIIDELAVEPHRLRGHLGAPEASAMRRSALSSVSAHSSSAVESHVTAPPVPKHS